MSQLRKSQLYLVCVLAGIVVLFGVLFWVPASDLPTIEQHKSKDLFFKRWNIVSMQRCTNNCLDIGREHVHVLLENPDPNGTIKHIAAIAVQDEEGRAYCCAYLYYLEEVVHLWVFKNGQFQEILPKKEKA